MIPKLIIPKGISRCLIGRCLTAKGTCTFSPTVFMDTHWSTSPFVGIQLAYHNLFVQVKTLELKNLPRALRAVLHYHQVDMKLADNILLH